MLEEVKTFEKNVKIESEGFIFALPEGVFCMTARLEIKRSTMLLENSKSHPNRCLSVPSPFGE